MHADEAIEDATRTPDRCRVCRSRIVVRGAAEILIKNAILRVEGTSGRVTAKCSRCKSWVEVPLRFTG